MAEVKWAEPAITQLNNILEYIAFDKPSAARNLARELRRSIARLAQFPKYGRFPSELPRGRYREVVHSPLRVFYRIEGDIVYIVYVMREEQALRKYLLSVE